MLVREWLLLKLYEGTDILLSFKRSAWPKRPYGVLTFPRYWLTFKSRVTGR